MKELNNNKILIIGVSVLAVIALGIGISKMDVLSKIEKHEEENEIKETKECHELVGGGFGVNFDTNGGNEIESKSVCIACGPDSYEELPVPVKENKEFAGWYYDENLTEKVETNYKTMLDVKAVPIIDENGCRTGYKTITLYAKWK